jgi:hypothetical protein
MRKRARRRSLRATDKHGAKERKDADMALSSISYNNKDKEEEEKEVLNVRTSLFYASTSKSDKTNI